MGMSATQARYLDLIARQSDLEFQGQQINQSRTTLSDQTNNLYTQLQNLSVPTPPVTSDYTTIVYSTTDGATSYTLGTIRPSTKQQGAYNMDLKFSSVGDSLSQLNTAYSISFSDSVLNVSSVSPTTSNVGTGTYSEDAEAPEFYINKTGISGSELPEDANLSDYMVLDADGKYVPASGEIDDAQTYYLKSSVEDYNKLDEAEKANYKGLAENTTEQTDDIIVNEADLSQYYIKTTDGTVIQLNKSSSPYVKSAGDNQYTIDLNGASLYKLGGSEELDNPSPNQLQIGGNTALKYSDAKELYGDSINWSNYEAAIVNTFGSEYSLDDFYYIISPSKSGSSYDVKMFDLNDIPTEPEANGRTVKGYSYSTGTYTTSTNYDYVDIQFDSTGRILKITIPTGYDENNEPISWKELDVKASTATDEAAYEDAMAEYEYEKYLYDQEQTAINAQMSIIQQQDKKLELKLQRLDNERTQITTEIEALEKVIDDNIESSYKTFSG